MIRTSSASRSDRYEPSLSRPSTGALRVLVPRTGSIALVAAIADSRPPERHEPGSRLYAYEDAEPREGK